MARSARALLPLGLLTLLAAIFAWGPAFQMTQVLKKYKGAFMARRRKNRSKQRELMGGGYKRGVCTRVFTMSPKKPNSAIRRVVRLTLSNKMETSAYVPGEGAQLQEFSSVLMRGSSVKDLAGVKYKLVPGVYDFQGIAKRRKTRSKYGASRPEDN